MRIAGIIEDDLVDCDDGYCVSLWVSGCPHRCKGCHNAKYWEYESGEAIDTETLSKIIAEKINKNGILRHFSILGGEPLADYNIEGVLEVIKKIRAVFSDKIKIYLWTGYCLEDIKDKPFVKDILKNIDVLIDGPYIEELRDTTLLLRGSSNQRVLYKKNNFEG